MEGQLVAKIGYNFAISVGRHVPMTEERASYKIRMFDFIPVVVSDRDCVSGGEAVGLVDSIPVMNVITNEDT